MRIWLILCVICATFPLAAGGQEPANPPAPGVADLAWLSGEWTLTANGETVDESWMAPQGGMMLGSNRTVSEGKPTRFEFMRLEETPDGVLFYASPQGKPATLFRLTATSPGRAEFTNSGNDFPQRIIYSREGERLVGTIAGKLNGQETAFSWRWERRSSPAGDPPAAREESAPATPTEAPSSESEPPAKTEGVAMFQGLRTVCYSAPDLEKAKRWYSQILGIEPYFDQPFYVGFNVGGFELGLDPDSKPIEGGHNVVVYWGVEDCQAAYDRLLQAGATSHTAPMSVGDGILVATVIDPFGNQLGVIRNPHFGKKE